MIGHNRCDGCFSALFLEDDMAAPLTDNMEPLLFEDLDEFASGNDGQMRHLLDGDFKDGHKGGFGRDGNFFGIGCLQEELYGLMKVFSGLFHRMTLTGDIQLGTIGDIPVPFMLNNRRQGISHTLISKQEVYQKTANGREDFRMGKKGTFHKGTHLCGRVSQNGASPILPQEDVEKALGLYAVGV